MSSLPIKIKSDSQYLGFINDIKLSENKMTSTKLIEQGYETFEEKYPALFYKKKSFSFEGKLNKF